MEHFTNISDFQFILFEFKHGFTNKWISLAHHQIKEPLYS